MKRAARPGEVAPFDLIVPAGETDFPPGPILSELKAAKIQAQVRGGKIVVAKDSLVAKAGETITETAAKGLQKLGILPFDVNVELLVAKSDGVIFTPDVLNVSKEQLSQDIKQAVRDAYALSINLSVPTEDNIKVLLQNAYTQGYILSINKNIYSPESIEMLLKKTLAQSRGIESFTKAS